MNMITMDHKFSMKDSDYSDAGEVKNTMPVAIKAPRLDCIELE